MSVAPAPTGAGVFNLRQSDSARFVAWSGGCGATWDRRVDFETGSAQMLSNSEIVEGHVIDTSQVKDRVAKDGDHSEILRRLTFSIGRSAGACRSATQALLNGADRDPELRAGLLTGIEEELQSIELILENLVQWRAFELGTFRVQRRSMNLRQWLPQVLARWHEAAERKGIHWRADLSPNLPPLTADPDRLGQVMNNLLTNAVDYTMPGNSITVEAGTQGSEVWLRVTNTGSELDAHELARVFEPFFSARMHGRFPQGIGIGLSVSRRMVEAQGGRITAESESGRGCIFTTWMPAPMLPA
jgi:signal transduction histidine kinase